MDKSPIIAFSKFAFVSVALLKDEFVIVAPVNTAFVSVALVSTVDTENISPNSAFVISAFVKFALVKFAPRNQTYPDEPPIIASIHEELTSDFPLNDVPAAIVFPS